MHRTKKRKLIVWLIFSLILLIMVPPSVTNAEDEVPVRLFDGRLSAEVHLNNLDYQDVVHSDTWAKNAIWETGALKLMKGYGAKRFGLSDMLTTEQAIAVAYNMAGREAEAQLAAEALDLERTARKLLAPAMWSDGYIQLAFNDGILTQEEYDDAFAIDQSVLRAADFRRNSPVSREDMAFYVAKVMGLTPIYDQTHLFNSYTDWQQANPHRIPYIEAILQNRVMNGYNGRFEPKGPLNREQAAQILQNAEPFLFTRLKVEKLKGTIERITSYDDKTIGTSTKVTEVNVRSSDGALHQFRFTRPTAVTGANEQAGTKNLQQPRGTIVNVQGNLKNEDALRVGQEIVYFVQNGQVQYAVVLSGQKNTVYHLVKILSADDKTGSIRCEILLDTPFFDVRLLDLGGLQQFHSTGEVKELTVSKAAAITVDLARKTLRDVKPETIMLITLENQLATAMENINSGLFQEKGIVSGILEENNPDLGYVTLYFPDGSGSSFDGDSELSSFRTYSWLSPQDVLVFKNGSSAVLEDLNPGDSIFLKLDETGIVTKISGADNYYPVYGRIRTKGNGTLQLQREDGAVELLQIPGSTPIFSDSRKISFNDLSEGDNVRLLLQTSGNRLVIGEVNVEKKQIEASGVYKAQLSYYDAMNKNLVVTEMQQFTNGIWKPFGQRGVTKLPVNENYSPEIPKGAQGTVYLAMGQNIIGKDTVVRMAIDQDSVLSQVVSDTIIHAQPGRGSLTLLNGDELISYGESSIILKGGRLLQPNQVKSQDEASIVVGMMTDGTQKANILWLREPARDSGLTLLRGRISQIDPMSNMTLQSFSQFRSPSWEYFNIPKTLTLDPTVTRIFDDDGRTDLTEFDDLDTDSFKSQTVYVLAQDGKAMLVSTAQYGDVVYSGRIQKLNGVVRDSFGQLVTPPSSFMLTEVNGFNLGTWNWESKANIELNLLANTVFYADEGIIDAGLLKEGDKLTVIRTASSNSALVVIVGNH
ncbi:MAG: S-layer homology domain-containing protein [Thermoclostridium sp.]|nr:S-layer homology domain-containing protein [Thermoclostridium sp.]